MSLYSNAPSSNPLALDGLVSGVFDTLYVDGQPVEGNGVPYVGAVADVDLGTFGLRATTLRTGPVSQSLRIQSADGSADYATFNYGGMGTTGQGIYITNGNNAAGTCDLTFTGKFQLKDSLSRIHMLTEWIGAPRNLSLATMGRIRLAQNTSDRALVIDATGEIESSTTTRTQIGYLDTLTSNVQTQIANIISSLGAYLPLAGGTMTASATINMSTTGSITNILNLSTASPASKFTFFKALEFNDGAQAIMSIFGGSNLPNIYTQGLLHPWGNIRTDTGHDTTWTLAGSLYFKDTGGATTAIVSNGAVIMANSRPITTDGGTLALTTAGNAGITITTPGAGGILVSTGGAGTVALATLYGAITINPGGFAHIPHTFTQYEYRISAAASEDKGIVFVNDLVSPSQIWRIAREVNSNRLLIRDSTATTQVAFDTNYTSINTNLRLPFISADASYYRMLFITMGDPNSSIVGTTFPYLAGVSADSILMSQTGVIRGNVFRSTAGQAVSVMIFDSAKMAGGSYATMAWQIDGASKMVLGATAFETFVNITCPQLSTTYVVASGLSNAGQFRAVYGNYGVMMRNDGGAFYFLLTNSGDAYGGWNGLRPFFLDLANGLLYSNNAQRFSGGMTACLGSGSWTSPNNPSNWDDYAFFVGGGGGVGSPTQYTNQAGGLGIGVDNGYNPRHVRLLALMPAIQWHEMHFGASIHVFWTFGVNLCGYVNAGGFVSLSDGRAKRDVRPIKTARSLERILRARPVTYRRIMPDDDKMIPDSERLQNHIGLIAQEVRDFNPHAVDSSASNEKQEYLGIRYNDFVIHLIGAVQEQQKQIAALEAKLEALQPWGSSPRPDADVAPGRRAEPYTDGLSGLGTFQSASALEARLAAQEHANALQQEQIDRLAAALQTLTESLTAQALRSSERALSPNLRSRPAK